MPSKQEREDRAESLRTYFPTAAAPLLIRQAVATWTTTCLVGSRVTRSEPHRLARQGMYSDGGRHARKEKPAVWPLATIVELPMSWGSPHLVAVMHLTKLVTTPTYLLILPHSGLNAFRGRHKPPASEARCTDHHLTVVFTLAGICKRVTMRVADEDKISFQMKNADWAQPLCFLAGQALQPKTACRGVVLQALTL